MILADFHLPSRLRRTLGLLARITCPSEIEELHLVERVVDRAEHQLRTLPPYLRGGLLAGATTFELGSLVWPKTFGRTFSSLDAPADLDRARAYFHSWWASPIPVFRQFGRGIKGVMNFAYFEEPTIKAHMEYHPDQWIAEAARRRLATYGADIERHEHMVTERDPLIRPAHLIRKVRHA